MPSSRMLGPGKVRYAQSMWMPPWFGKSSPEVEAALSRVRIFSTLGRRDLRKLSSACLLRHYDAGEAILEEGTTGLGLFIITAGRVEVFMAHEGGRVPLAVLGEGDVLGEMALLDDRPRSASAVALEATDCLLLSRDRFRTLLKRRPRIAWPIVPSLVGRVRDLQSQLLDRASSRPSSDGGSSPDAEPPAAEPEPVAAAPAEVEPASAGDAGSPAPHLDEAADGGRSEPDVLRAPYALMMTGAVGFGESIRVVEVFFRTLDETSGLSVGRPMGEVMRELPASVATAGNTSWDRGRQLPSKLLGTFREHLEADWRDET